MTAIGPDLGHTGSGRGHAVESQPAAGGDVHVEAATRTVGTKPGSFVIKCRLRFVIFWMQCRTVMLNPGDAASCSAGSRGTLQDRLMILVSDGATVRVRPVADLQDAVATLGAASSARSTQGLQS
ncbi:hypothetical protein [Streptomyces sp. AS58]|uniref:hypothetical protein n=1 Tax=Streptomyces sp. AS58 TaxID=1519489 RepID=UPI00131A7B52|nr:hypothetical protein [Streptomyces sp. AS58]